MSWTEQPLIHLWAAPDREIAAYDPVIVDFGIINASSFQWTVQLQAGTSTACLSGGNPSSTSAPTANLTVSSQTVSSTPASSATSSSPSTGVVSTAKQTKPGISNVGNIAIGAVLAILVSAVLIVLIIWRRKRSNTKKNSHQLDGQIQHSIHMEEK